MPSIRNGRYYVQRTFPGVGRLYKSLHTTRKGRADSRERILVSLSQQGRLELLRAFRDGDVAIQEIEDAFERNRLHELARELREATSPLAAAIEAALEAKRPDVKTVTLDGYRASLRHAQDFAAPDATVDEVLTEDFVQSFKAHRLDEGAAEQTVNNDVGALSILATYAERKGWIDERPTIKRYTYRARIRWLDPGQLATYMATIRPAFRRQQQVLVGSGMRLGESERLRVCDVRLDSDDRRALVEDAKTDDGVRAVFLPRWVTEELRTHIEEEGLRGTDRLFRIPRRTVQAEHDRACGIAGIPDYRIHDHRHTAAVYLARAGLPLQLLQQQLGHANIDQTMIYARFHPDYSDVGKYFDRVEQRLTGAIEAAEGDPGNNIRHNTPTEEASRASE